MDRLSRVSRISAASALVLVACGAASPKTGPRSTAGREAPAATSSATDDGYAWEPATRSPQPLEGLGEPSSCRNTDRALLRVAERIAAREAAGRPPLDTAELTFALRSEGAPYVWPRAWTLAGSFERETEEAKLTAWLETLGEHGEKRCAVAVRPTRGSARALSAVAVSVLADLEPLPTRVAIGTWLDVRAVLLVPATSADVVVLGPQGRPHSVLASLAGASVRARFRADREGAWVVQIVATTAGGPRLVAEALVSAGRAPPATYDLTAAPGEEISRKGARPDPALLAMINEARRLARLAPLGRDAELDRLALEQAMAIRERRALSHEASGSDLAARLAQAGLGSAGENVAHATDVARAHRSLWRSPSHRENLLHPTFELVGIGVLPDADGSVWVCQIFGTRNTPY